MSVLGFAALGLYAAILVVKLVLARRYVASHVESLTAVGDVTVLQPILSGDPALGETLRCNLEQVDARFLWLVDEDDAEGLRITGELAKGSNGRAVILRCPPVSGNDNPKTVKLQRGLAAVETEYVAVLDDDTIVTPKHIGRAVFALRTCTLYTGLPCYLGGGGFWSSLVTHFVNNNSTLTYLPLLPLIGPLTINGMFYVMRSEELRAMGGFAPITAKLCDDYALATLVRSHGGTIRQGVTRQYLRTTVPSAAHYVRLMHRWFLFANILVRDQPFSVQLLLFFALGLPPLLLWTGFVTLSYALPFVLVLRHLVIRSMQGEHLPQDTGVPRERRHPAGWRGGSLPPYDVAAAGSRRSSRLEGGAPVKDAAILSILSELLQPLHWLHATLQHTLRWRTRRIDLGADGTFTYLGGPAS